MGGGKLLDGYMEIRIRMGSIFTEIDLDFMRKKNERNSSISGIHKVVKFWLFSFFPKVPVPSSV